MTDHDPREHLRQLMDWARNYQSSRVLTTAVEKEILERFQDGPFPLEGVVRPGEDPDAVERFVRTVSAMDLLQYEGEENGYLPTELTRQYLLPGAPYDVRPILALFHRNYDLWAKLPETLEKGYDVENEAFGDVEFGQEFMLAMETRAHFAKQDVAEVASNHLGPGDQFIDLGGGTGVFCRAILEEVPDGQAVLADLEHVVETARNFCEDSSVVDRIEFQQMDFFEDETYGDGFDAALLFSICHMFEEDRVGTIFQRTANSLKPGGTLCIRDYVLNEDRIGPLAGNLFDLHMLMATDTGRNYSLEDYRRLLREAGFVDVERVKLPGGDDLIVAHKGEEA